ncbi:MAG: type VI secretion system contractile sheath small subunit [SAR324 cluster bacterium]|nr:type VI secretion system contractile sheath small subunit [SAR324 cluster bacterium]
MSQKASVSPKERVNIVYKTEIGDINQEVELPLKVLVMGDFSFQADATPLEDREVMDLNNDNFDDILASHNLSIDMDVADKLSGNKDASISMHLEFKSIKDFNPDSIIEQVPELKKVIELRKAVTALKGPLGNIPAFRRQIQEILDNEGLRNQLIQELGI